MKPLRLEHVPALATPLHVVLVHMMEIAKLLMVAVSVEQTVIRTVIVALMSTVLNVNKNALFFLRLL